MINGTRYFYEVSGTDAAIGSTFDQMGQPFWTIATGALVIIIGKIFDSFCIAPYMSYKKVIGEITFQLIFYAREYSSPSLPNKHYIEAESKLRSSASRLNAYYNPISWLGPLLLPSPKDIKTATNDLIKLANNSSENKSLKAFEINKTILSIRSHLRIKG